MADAARAFELAGQAGAMKDAVIASAHAAINVMADGPRKTHAKRLTADAKELIDGYQGIVFAVYPAALTYYPGMAEAELREWAAGLMAALP